MRRAFGAAAALAAATAAAGCDALLAPDPGTDAVAVAQAAWEEIDAYHAFFEETGLDWDSVGAVHLPRVGLSSSNAELLAVLSDMIDALRDGHARLVTPSMSYAWTGWRAGRPANFDESLLSFYVSAPAGTGANGAVRWGMLDGGIGYMRIASFGRVGIGGAVDAALAALGDPPGLVIDIRGNGGGSDTHSRAAAGRFVPQRTLYRTHRYKNGPAHGDFGPETPDYVEPTGSRSYDGPVVVLQNRMVFSAAEDFVLAMRVRPGVTFVGDTTGGGSGNPIPRELPNRWVVRVSRWQVRAADGTWYEGVGLAPDVTEGITGADVAAGRDPMLERAIELLGDPDRPQVQELALPADRASR